MCKQATDYFINKFNDIKLPKQDLRASEIIKMSKRETPVNNKKLMIQKCIIAAVCFCFLIIAGREAYASSIAQEIVRFTKYGFVIGKEQSVEVSDVRSLPKNNTGKEITEETTVTEDNGENEKIFKDLKQVYQNTGMPEVFPAVIIDNFTLSGDGINYSYDTSGNLTESQWTATYTGKENEQVYLYLDYADWEGEPDTRYGSAYNWVSKHTVIKQLRKYVSEKDITFAMAKLGFAGKNYYIAVMSAGNYYYFLQFENMEKKEIYKVLDSVNFNLSRESHTSAGGS